VKKGLLIGGVCVGFTQGLGLHTTVLMTDFEDGTYEISFEPRVAGMHSIIIMLDYVPIEDVPFDPTYRALDGVMQPAHSRLVTEWGTQWIGVLQVNAPRPIKSPTLRIFSLPGQSKAPH
jgi:hypothetical protein